MNWRVKAMALRVISHLPRSDIPYQLVQRYVTRSLPIDRAAFLTNVKKVRAHLDLIQSHSAIPLADLEFFELGAGWELTGPLAMYCWGVDSQILVDVRRLLRADLVNNTLRELSVPIPDTVFSRTPGGPLVPSGLLAQLEAAYGIRYLAPVDVRKSGLTDAAVDCVISTDTFEHIPAPDIASIIRECHRILRPGGLMSVRIDYQDHFAAFDMKITAYNFLTYTDSRWALYSPPLHFQNRLRHVDYLKMLDVGGFDIVETTTCEGSDDDVRQLRSLSIDKRYASYTLEELAVRTATIIARRRAETTAQGLIEP